MLQLTLSNFASLVVVSLPVAWRGNRQLVVRQVAWVASCLLSAGLLYGLMRLLAPGDPALYLPTFAVALVVPVVAIAVVLQTLAASWSPAGRVALVLSIAAGSALVSPLFLLAATCLVQSNCL